MCDLGSVICDREGVMDYENINYVPTDVSWKEGSFVFSNCPFIKRQGTKSVRFDESVTKYLDDYQEPLDASIVKSDDEKDFVGQFPNLANIKKKNCKHKRKKDRSKNVMWKIGRNKQEHFFCRHIWQGITRYAI